MEAVDSHIEQTDGSRESDDNWSKAGSIGKAVKWMLRQLLEFSSACKNLRVGEAWVHLWATVLLSRDLFRIACRKNMIAAHCSVCEWDGPTFLHCVSVFRPRIRANAKCPNCGSLERHRDIALWLKKNLLERDGMDEELYCVLNVAPDPGFDRLWEEQQSCIIEMDIQPLEGIRVVMDLHSLGFEDQCFDLVLCSHVLEHVRDDIQCMKEIQRVLKKRGIAILPAPINNDLNTTVEFSNAQHGHVRDYGRDYFERLCKVGLKYIPGARHIAACQKTE